MMANSILKPPEKYYYPVSRAMWDALLQWHTEEKLYSLGFIPTDYLEV